MSVLRKILDILNENFPKFVQIIEAISTLNILLFFKSMNSRFSTIFNKNIWGSNESISGEGSIFEKTTTIREEIPIALQEIQAKSLLDIPCGDFNWLKHTTLNIESYIGGDIVPELIAKNKKKYENNNRTFTVIDITQSDLPEVDIILCRDCLVHLSYKDIFKAISNFKKSKSKYLLSTTFTSRRKNRNIFTGGWRPINLQLPPFNFPKAIKTINEKCTEADGRMFDKSLGLWRLENIKNP